jgi:hypothetical protein
MSANQTFASFLKEDLNPTYPSPGNVVIGLDHEEQEHSLKLLNSMLAGITDSPAFNPYYLVERIKTRLKLAMGVSFDDTYFVGEVGSFEKPLYAHNDVVSVEGGMLPPNDNSWLKLFPHGLLIKFQFLKSGKFYNVNAEIVARPDYPLPPSISED